MKSLFLLPAVLRFVVAESHAYPFYQSSDFSSGKLGPYPNRTFNSRPDLTAPALNYISSSSACDDGLYTILSLRGDAVESDGEIEGRAPMILDGKGELVWMDPKYGETYDLAVQSFEGREYLTFWQGKGRKEGHSTGVYVMVRLCLSSLSLQLIQTRHLILYTSWIVNIKNSTDQTRPSPETFMNFTSQIKAQPSQPNTSSKPSPYHTGATPSPSGTPSSKNSISTPTPSSSPGQPRTTLT